MYSMQMALGNATQQVLSQFQALGRDEGGKVSTPFLHFVLTPSLG